MRNAGGGGGRAQAGRLRAEPDAQDEPDIVTKMFGAIFGKKALEDPEPFGLKRLSADDAPEMYPATTTEFAEAVESDTAEMAAIRPLLARTQLEKRQLRLAYDAETDGWDAASFHAKVDSFGAAVVMAQTAGGAWVGGYNPRGWIGLGEDRNSIAAFLFTWPTGDLSQRAVKLPKAGGAALSVLDKPGTGPVFGADGLKILLQSGRERIASCKLGPYYEKLPGGGVSLFAECENRKASELLQLRVYVGEGGGEEWELDGIVWKTKLKDA